MRMNFYLLKMAGRKLYPIQISLSWDGNRIQKTIGLSVKEGEFDTKREKFKRNIHNEKELNSYLENIKTNINEYYYNNLALKKAISKPEFLSFLNNLLQPEENNAQNFNRRTIPEIVSDVLERISNSPEFQHSTIKKYRTNVNYIISFQKDELKKKIFIEDVNQDLIKKYAYFLSLKKNLQDPSIHKSIKIFSTLLNKAFEFSFTDNNQHKIHFSNTLRSLNLNTESQKFALSNDEFKKIFDYVPSSDIMQISKDCFLLQIFTGLRYNDLKAITKERIDFDNKILKFQQTKTNNDVIIPLIEPALQILEKYYFSLPVPSIKKLNDNIRDICENAGLNDTIERVWKSLNRRKVTKIEKFKVISNHYGRLTFTVESLRGGALDREVMASTGHRDSKSFEVYKKIAKPEGIENVRSALEKRFGKKNK
ncbi:MAG: hypothetical protein A2X64_00085 [Ignavibacteria bacterium GWF2_33_9]|nr:MAG: hypothetical protein A2X64_00085 [Ignavibacteria bacterium GWF2_33_9]